MTVTAARPLALVPDEPVPPGGDRLERVRALLRTEFLAEVWDAGGEVFAPPREHPLLGLRKCAVVDCEAGVRTPNIDLCKLCIEKFKVSGLPMEKFTAIPASKISKGEQFCRVLGCLRPSPLRVRLCHSPLLRLAAHRAVPGRVRAILVGQTAAVVWGVPGGLLQPVRLPCRRALRPAPGPLESRSEAGPGHRFPAVAADRRTDQR